jgi:Kdo2-lipid IVA lauroyltransferase/acyltransferase
MTPLSRTAAQSHISRDLREGGRWTAAQAVKNAAIYFLVRGTLAVMSPWPARFARGLGREVLGKAAYGLFPRERRTAYENIGRVFPSLTAPERGRLVREVYNELGAHLGDTVALLSKRNRLVPLAIEETSRVVLHEAMRGGRGVVFVSAHLGPWERVAASLVAAGIPLTTIAREGYDPRLTKLFDNLRQRYGVKSIYRGTAGAAVRIIRTLRRGEVLGAPMDLKSRVPSIVAPFLGSPASTAVGPARIALRTGAAVVVGTAAPIQTEPGTDGLGITVSRIPTDGLQAGAEGERALTTKLNAELSRRILALPRAWVWMHPRW